MNEPDEREVAAALRRRAGTVPGGAETETARLAVVRRAGHVRRVRVVTAGSLATVALVAGSATFLVRPGGDDVVRTPADQPDVGDVTTVADPTLPDDASPTTAPRPAPATSVTVPQATVTPSTAVPTTLVEVGTPSTPTTTGAMQPDPTPRPAAVPGTTTDDDGGDDDETSTTVDDDDTEPDDSSEPDADDDEGSDSSGSGSGSDEGSDSDASGGGDDGN